MFMAPQPVLSAVHRSYASGVRGVRQTVAIMRQLVNEARTDLRIRQAATSLTFLVPEKFDHGEVAKLLDYCQRSIRYVRDVLDVETLSSAWKTLEGRVGDCDDKSVLLAALCEAIGYPTRFVVAGYESPSVFEHVYCQIAVDGVWLDADPTEREPLGWAPPDPACLMIEGN
jgi:transglutaminase-like putative cysteine protease